MRSTRINLADTCESWQARARRAYGNRPIMTGPAVLRVLRSRVKDKSDALDFLLDRHFKADEWNAWSLSDAIMRRRGKARATLARKILAAPDLNAALAIATAH